MAPFLLLITHFDNDNLIFFYYYNAWLCYKIFDNINYSNKKYDNNNSDDRHLNAGISNMLSCCFVPVLCFLNELNNLCELFFICFNLLEQYFVGSKYDVHKKRNICTLSHVDIIIVIVCYFSLASQESKLWLWAPIDHKAIFSTLHSTKML